MTRYTSLGIRNNEHPVLHSEDKTSPETGIRKRDGNAYPARYNERRNRKNEKASKHRLCACNFRQVGQKSRFIIFKDDTFGEEQTADDFHYINQICFVCQIKRGKRLFVKV